MTPDSLLLHLENLLGGAGLLTDAAARLVYSRDASHLELGQPLAVALPATVDQLQQVVALCAAAGVPIVTRGSGTGLSGGAVPDNGSLVLGTGRLQALGEVAVARGQVRAEAGVLNEQVSRRAAPDGLHFAPDPSSQSAATIGGNIATNAGGPHCLRHGVTLHHLARLEWIGCDGSSHVTGRGVAGERGLDLVSLLCGSEGTLGVVAAANLDLVVNPSDVVTLLAFFPDLDDATGAVVELLGEGLLPVAVEMVDQPMLRAVEEAFGFGFPTDVQAALIAEFCGQTEAVAEDGLRATSLLQGAGASEVRRAVDEAERATLWMCRKKAFGAVGRLAPSYVTMDVVVPLAELPDLVREIQVIKAKHGVEIATAFHAGDGNLHPGVHYDDRDADACRRAHAAADEIIAAAIAREGSATGEHGVGIEKKHVLPWQLDAVTTRLHYDIKRVCDPDFLLNPGKLLPEPSARSVALKHVPESVAFRWGSLTVTAPGAARLSEIQSEALARGLWLPVGLPGRSGAYGLAHDPTVAELLDHLAVGPAMFATRSTRDVLLESWAETGGGERFHSGAPVFKNVAGYDLHHMLCGSGGVFVRHLAATFQLRPRPERALVVLLRPSEGVESDLSAVWDLLAGRTDRLASPQVIVDSQVGIHLLIAGRDRPWDLGRVPTDLRAVLAPSGWSVDELAQVPFAEAPDLLAQGLLPSWALAAQNWTALAPRPDAGFAPDRAPWGRYVHQGASGRVWVPAPQSPPDGWFADPVIVSGQVGSPPPPTRDVPRSLLRGLKQVFDPAHSLPTPEWLGDAEVTHG